MSADFRRGILDEVSHRPWPMPNAPWVMTQTWNDLLFAHWRVDAAVLRPLVPPPLELDRFDNHAWVAVVPFHMTNIGLRGLSWIGIASAFAELNVRTYVTYGGKAGVYFFSLDAANRLAVVAARTFFQLPYFSAEMAVDVSRANVHYRSRRKAAREGHAELFASYRPIAEPEIPQAGTREHFLTERYCLFTVDARSRVRRVDIHHPPWALQRASAEIVVNTMAVAAGIRLPAEEPLLHFSKRQDVVAWGPAKV
jgi:uncharacterized protein YqjF (DUF2071 family)